MAQFVTAEFSDNAEPCILRYEASSNRKLDIKFNAFDSHGYTHLYDYSNQGIIIFEKPINKVGYLAFDESRNNFNIDIPEDVTEMGWDIDFQKKLEITNRLISIELPNSITTIEASAFNGCKRLRSIHLPNNITCIEDNAFLDCDNLAEVHISDLSVWCKIIFKDIFSTPLNNEYAKLLIDNQLITQIVIPKNIKSINNYAFYNCRSLKKVAFHNNITNIGDNAFYGCHELENVVIPDSVTLIGNGAFYNCYSITDLIIGNGVLSIGKYAFEDCQNIKNISIGKNIKTIEDGAFMNCCQLSTIICKSNTPPKLGKNVFEGIYRDDLIVIVPNGRIDAYLNSDWKEYLK